nr:MAG TPA: hypothetical protein [Bacteriophage sp.]
MQYYQLSKVYYLFLLLLVTVQSCLYYNTQKMNRLLDLCY